MLKGIVLYLLFCVGVPYNAVAQVSLFQNLTTRDGLPSNYIFDACEDARGYLWLGTDKGLATFDGFHWKLYTTEDGLPGNYISTVLQAGADGLWIVISSKGLYYYSIVTGRLTFISSNCQDNFFQTDQQGAIFFYQQYPVNQSGFNWVHPGKLSELHQFTIPARPGDAYTFLADFPERLVQAIPVAGIKGLPATTISLPNGWRADTMAFEVDEAVRYRRAAAGIYYSNSSVFYFLPGQKPVKKQLYASSNSYLNALRYGNETVVWNEKDGLYFLADDGSARHYGESDGLGSNMVTDVHILQNGRLLICTLGGGLSYKLPEGNAILQTDGQAVKGLVVDEQQIYAAAGNQLTRLRLEDLQVKRFPLPRNQVQSVDKLNGLLYFSSLSGVTIAREQNDALAELQFLPLGAGVSNVIFSGNRLIAGTFGIHVSEIRNQLYYPDSTTPYVSEKVMPFSGGYVSFNYEDGLQFVYHNGKREMLTTANGLPSNAVYDVHEYKDSCWISTARGLALFVNNKHIKTYTEKEGLAGSRCIYSFHDHAGNCWVVTDKYLGRVEGGRVRMYLSTPIRDRYNDYVHKAGYIASRHTLVTGTAKNIYLTRLDNLQPGLVMAPPALQRIVVNGDTVSGRQFRIPLNYQSLSFVFRPLLVNPFGKATIYYRLSGYDDQYFELKDSLEIHFSRLRSGNYLLMARTMNEDGVMGEDRMLCSFTVTPPFWQTKWFMWLAVLGTGLLAYGLTRGYYRRKQLRREKERALQAQLEQERARISRELHDNLGTSLVTIIAQSDNIETKLLLHQPEEALKKVIALGDQSRDTMNMLRETIWAVQGGAHPFSSFVNRIRDFLQRTYAAFPAEYRCESEGDPGRELSPEQILHLFRCIQECTQNILKHANATQVMYHLSLRNRQLVLVIIDNGRGFDPAAMRPGNGLANMQKRIQELKGTFRVDSTPGKGTTITVEITI